MSEPTYVQEYEAIVEVLNRYAEGNAKASGAAMKPAFHEKATIFGLDGPAVFGPEIEKLYAVIDSLEPSPGMRASYTRVEIAGTAASARVDSDDIAGSRYTDFLNLLKIDGKWTIVSKVYYRHPGG